MGNLFAVDNNYFNSVYMIDQKQSLVQEWDKVFPQSDKVHHMKVTFRNRYGIILAADKIGMKLDDAYIKDAAQTFDEIILSSK